MQGKSNNVNQLTKKKSMQFFVQAVFVIRGTFIRQKRNELERICQKHHFSSQKRLKNSHSYGSMNL